MINVAGSPNSIIIMISGQKIRTLIDTGAEVSLLKKKTFETIKQKGILRPEKVNLQSVSGEPLRVHGSAVIPFAIGGVKQEHKFYIVEDMNRICILGRDWMISNDVRLYFDLKKLRVRGGAYVDLEDDIHIASILRLNESASLRPHTVNVLGTNLIDCPYYSQGDTLRVSQAKRGPVSEEPGILTPDTLVTLSDSRNISIVLENHTNRWISLKTGTEVGQVEAVEQVRIVDGVIKEQGYDEELFEEGMKKDFHCAPEYRSIIEPIVRENWDVFAFSDLQLGRTQTHRMEIKTGDAKPVSCRPRRTPLHNRPKIEKAVKEMLDAGVIEPSDALWSSPVVLVKKKGDDAGDRFCIDYRGLNAVTEDVVYPMPLIDDLLAILHDKPFISSLDLRSGFWSLPLTEDAKDKTTFSCHVGSFRFLVTPFGLKGAPNNFMKLIDLVLKDLKGFSSAYIDDILIYSPTLESHLEHLKQVFGRLRQHNLKAKLKKCTFVQKETKYLGYVITKDGITPDPEKVRAIRNLPQPTDVRSARAALGLMGWYRKLIKNYSSLADPIVALTKKYARFQWTEECQAAFDELKDKLASIPMLSHPNVRLPYRLYVDASEKNIGAMLCQPDDENGDQDPEPMVRSERPVYFLSHKLSKTQIKWSILEKECYAIYYALNKLDFFLHNSRFTIYSDHKPLKYLLQSPMENKRVARWALTISSYNADIRYIEGSKNSCADLLSRALPNDDNSTGEEEELDDVHDNALHIQEVTVTRGTKNEKEEMEHDQAEGPDKVGEGSTKTINMINSNDLPDEGAAKYVGQPLPNDETEEEEKFDMIEQQDQDPAVLSIKKKLKQGTDRKIMSKYILVDGRLYFIADQDGDVKLRLYVPQHLQQRIVKEAHELGHIGIDTVYDNLREKYYFPQMFPIVYAYVDSCSMCKLHNLKPHKAPLQETDVATFAFAKISIDVSGPHEETLSGNKYMIYFVDHYSRWPEVYATADKTSQTVAQLLLSEIIPRHSCPQVCLTDNGGEFTSQIMKETLKELNIKPVKTTPYRPQSNAKNERYHGRINRILAKLVGDNPKTWDLHIQSALASVRFSVHRGTRFSPFYLLYGRMPILPIDNLLRPRRKYTGEEPHRILLQQQHKSFLQMYQNLLKANKNQKKYADKKVTKETIEVGDRVYYINNHRTTKFDPRWRANYVVLRKTGPVSYVIKNQLTGLTERAHFNQLRKTSMNWVDHVNPIEKPVARKSTLAQDPEEGINFESTDESGEDIEEEHGVDEEGDEELLDKDDSQKEETSGFRNMLTRLRTERVDSSDEDDIPLLQLRKKIRKKKDSEATESWDSEDEVPLATLRGRRTKREFEEKEQKDHYPTDSPGDMEVDEARITSQNRKKRSRNKAEENRRIKVEESRKIKAELLRSVCDFLK